MNVRNATESHSCKRLQRHALCIFYHSVLKDVVVRFRPSPNISASEEMHQEAAPKELHGNKNGNNAANANECGLSEVQRADDVPLILYNFLYV